MIFIGFLITSILLASTVLLYNGSLLSLINIIAMFLIIVVPVIILLFSGIETGNRLIFKTVFSLKLRNNYSKRLQETLLAATLLKTTTLAIGIIVFIMGTIYTLFNIEDTSAIGPGLADSFLSLLYATSLAYIIYNPVCIKIKYKLNQKNRQMNSNLYRLARRNF